LTSIAAGRHRPLSELAAWADRRSHVLAPAALGALMAIAAVVLYRKGLGLTFYYDEWSFVMDRRGWDLDAFLEPHNEHIALLPAAIFKLLFVTAGLDDYWTYRIVAIIGHLATVALLFVLLRRRIGDWPAVLGAALVLLLGTAWADLLWPFEIGFVGSIAAGLGMLIAFGRGDRKGDVLAAFLLGVALAFSSIGLPISAIAFVEVVLTRGWRRLWIPLAPIALWGLWYLTYGRDGVLQETDLGIFGLLKHNIPLAPRYLAEMLAAGFGALLGLESKWGRPLAIAAVVLLAVLFFRRVSLTPRFFSLFAGAAAFFGLTAAFRAHIGDAAGSRYTYLSAILIVLIGAELLHDRRFTSPAVAILGVVVVAAAVGNYGKLQEGSRLLHETSGFVASELGALEVAGAPTDPAYRPDPVRAPPISAAPYFDAVEDLGSPGDSPGEVLSRPEPMRQAADSVLIHALGVSAEPGGEAASGAAPPVEGTTGGAVRTSGACVRFAPAEPGAALDMEVPDDGLLIQSSGLVELRLRSFATGFPEQPLASFGPGKSSLRPPARDSVRWHARLAAGQPLSVCSLGS
jgi:hypothetical protein